MKHIVFSINQLGGGGAERVVSVWANQLVSQGMRVSIVLMHRQSDEYEVDPRVNVVALGDTKEEYLSMSYLKRLMLLRKVIKKLSPSTLINFLPRMQIMVYLATMGMRFYRIETVRNNPWKMYEKNSFEKVLWNRCFQIADRIIVQTNGQKDFFHDSIKKKCVLIPNPINTIYGQPFEKEYNEKVCRFVAAGRIHPQKNYPMMINAFAKACQVNSNIYLDIYGSGDAAYQKQMEQIILSLNVQDRVHFCGKTSALVNEYHLSDAYILSSDYEGMPNALAEAMASKLICISTNCPTGPSDLIEDGKTGYLVNVGDVKSLTKIIELVADMSVSERKQMSEQARQMVLTLCSEESSLNRLKKIIQ